MAILQIQIHSRIVIEINRSMTIQRVSSSKEAYSFNRYNSEKAPYIAHTRMIFSPAYNLTENATNGVTRLFRRTKHESVHGAV